MSPGPCPGAGAHRHRDAVPGARLSGRDAGRRRRRIIHEFPALLGTTARLIEVTTAGLDLLVLDAPDLYDRQGGIYLRPDGRDHPDNWRRYAALCIAASEIAAGALPDFQPDLVHAHDWQAGLVPLYLRFRGIPVPSILTVHNIAFQGISRATSSPGWNCPRPPGRSTGWNISRASAS